MATESLEDLIRRYVILGKRSAKGYETVKCEVCHDYQARGGFKLEGDNIHYSCFNCSTSAGYNEAKGMYKPFRDVLLAFNIPREEIDRCVNSAFFKEKKDTPQGPAKKETSLPTAECPLPPGSVKVTSDASPWCEVAREYLAARGLKPEVFDYYVTDDEKFAGRLLIPYVFRSKVVYWQGRAMDETITPRYKNPVVEKDNIFFNMDEVYRYTDEPLFVCEGPLDALSIGQTSIALLGSTLTEFRAKELKRLRRKVIFVLDKNPTGQKLGLNVLRIGEDLQWYVTVFPPNIDDANDALVKLGKLWLAKHLSSTAVKGFDGKLLVEMRCGG